MITMLDTVTPSAIGRIASTSSDAIAGYVDGIYKDIGELERDYPNHIHLTIAAFPSDDADALDVETGDARPEDAPGWIRRQHARGLARPWLYANRSTWASVNYYLNLAGVTRGMYIKWVADPDEIAELNLGMDEDAKQYTFHWQGRNVDASVVRDEAFAVARPKPKRKHHHHPVARRRKIVKLHPKAKGAIGTGGLGVGAVAISHALGLKLTPAEAAGIATFLSSLGAYLAPARSVQR